MFLKTLWSRITAFRQGDRIHDEIDEEMRFHLQLRTEENIRQGMPPDEAEADARKRFGHFLQVKERGYDVRGGGIIESIFQDVQFGLRTLRKNPGFTAVAVAILAVGIGFNVAVFTVTNAMLFKGFPNVDPDGRLLYIGSVRRDGTCCGSPSYPDYQDWRAQTKSFEDLGVVNNGGLRMRLNDDQTSSAAYDATELSANSFQVLGVPPVIGRDFSSTDEAADAPPVAIISDGLWTRRYGRSPSIVGEKIRINDVTTEVIGVMPPGFDFPHHRVDLWIPIVPAKSPVLHRRQSRGLWFAFGKLAPGSSLDSVRAELDGIGRRLEIAYPETNKNIRPGAQQFHEFFLGPRAALTYGSMWAAVGFVLLIACANQANLFLARAIERSREISVRIALGAGFWRIVRQLLVESVLLSGAGGVLGLAIAWYGVHFYESVADYPNSYNRWSITIDYRVFVYLFGVSLLTGILIGLPPAFRLARTDINAMVKSGGRGAIGGRQGKRLSALLVIGEVALAVVLLAGAGVLIRSFYNMYKADLGVDTANVLVADVRLPASRYGDAATRTGYFEQLVARLQGMPGVESITVASSAPGSFATRAPYELSEAPAVEPDQRPTASMVSIAPDYFRTLKANLIMGRDFTNAETTAALPVAIVNQRFAAASWPKESPIGKHVRLSFNGSGDSWFTVVGMASNIIQNDPTGQNAQPTIYVPFAWYPASDVLARTIGPAAGLKTELKRELDAIDPDAAIYTLDGQPTTLTAMLASNYWSAGVTSGLFFVFAAVAFVMASLGLYAVVAHSVSQRTQEIGLRIAVGASRSDILRFVFREGMVPLIIGLAIGLPASLAVNRLLASQLVQVSPFDPLTLSIGCSGLIAAAVLGCFAPARRATRVDPVVALRCE